MSTETTTPTTRSWLGLIAVSLGVALIVVDLTIVNVIVAPIIDDLSITSTEAQWIQESYAIVFAALLLLTGRLADLWGARRLFLLGLAVFGVTSLLAAAAPNGELLIMARFLQGIGGAMILPTSLALVNATFTGQDRSRAFAVWGSTIGAAAAVGPLLGGWLAGFSWRWAFGINIPLVILIAVGALAYLPTTPRGRGGVDAIGAVLSALGLGLLAFGLIEGRSYGWFATTEPLRIAGFTWDSGPSPVLVAFALAAAALVACWRRQDALARAGAEPLLDTGLFRIGSFRKGNIVTLVVGIGEFGIIAVLPLWLQFTLDYSAVQAGLALVPLAVGSFCASGASFSLTASVSALGQVRIGLALEAVGLTLLGLCAAADSAWWPIAVALFVYGVGVGFATAQVTNVVLTEVPADRAGQASGVQSAARELGSALGIAVVTTVFFTALDTGLRDRLAPGQDGLATAVTDSAGSMIPALATDPGTAATAVAAREAMTSGLGIAAYLCAALLALSLVSTALLPTANKPANTVA
ncbi:DHA2 family efflux MFS transporter permease subunit [Nocardia otitidiscaviarum]|uniref:DHA2 family efflux MFS transporter permease subunit n=1 Tax=Nocardia otitidiscaviarum TaxID=1823 RepID=UPI001FD0BC6F|nr:DHA2 family efflux MFS transporter permease subunit [Nocardia otitidiscaviarum]MCP9625045.1 DHA2 family efflux MFS transporter permease subunit [Nocardia otitidiscaviarum]